jgi:hypothetical protein
MPPVLGLVEFFGGGGARGKCERTPREIYHFYAHICVNAPMIIAMFMLDSTHNKCSQVLFRLCVMAWYGGMA